MQPESIQKQSGTASPKNSTNCKFHILLTLFITIVRFLSYQLNVFDHVKKSSRGHHSARSLDEIENHELQSHAQNIKISRDKRQLNYDPVLAFCDCPNINFECTPDPKPKTSNGTRCYCFRNKEYQALYPCYNEKMWTTLDCEECSYTGRCTHPPGGKVESGKKTRKCLCPALATYCVLLPSNIDTIGDPMLFTRYSQTSITFVIVDFRFAELLLN